MNKNIVTMREKDIRKTSVKQTVVKIAVKVFIYAFLIIMAIIVLFPFYWMINSSLKSLDETYFFPTTRRRLKRRASGGCLSTQ